MALVKQVYRVSTYFPREEIYGLTSQIRRASVSIPSNIAEGHGRFQTKDFVRFLGISVGSLFEVQTQLEIAHDLGYLSQQEIDDLKSATEELKRMLSSLIRKLDCLLTK